MDAAAPGSPQPAPLPAGPGPAARLETALARFHLGCLALRDVQVAVHLLGSEPQMFLLPARSAPKAAVELVVTAKGRLRTCLEPEGLTEAQRAAVRDLAWAVYDHLAPGSEGGPAAELQP